MEAAPYFAKLLLWIARKGGGKTIFGANLFAGFATTGMRVIFTLFIFAGISFLLESTICAQSAGSISGGPATASAPVVQTMLPSASLKAAHDSERKLESQVGSLIRSGVTDSSELTSWLSAIQSKQAERSSIEADEIQRLHLSAQPSAPSAPAGESASLDSSVLSATLTSAALAGIDTAANPDLTPLVRAQRTQHSLIQRMANLNATGYVDGAAMETLVNQWQTNLGMVLDSQRADATRARARVPAAAAARTSDAVATGNAPAKMKALLQQRIAASQELKALLGQTADSTPAQQEAVFNQWAQTRGLAVDQLSKAADAEAQALLRQAQSRAAATQAGSASQATLAQ